ncbi:hypothetical protein SFRURICE_001175, partial [Spodoptera frugiperda]
MTWDGPYHNSVSRSRIMIRVSFPVHICDHDTRRRYGYGDRIGQMIHVWTRLKSCPVQESNTIYFSSPLIISSDLFRCGIQDSHSCPWDVGLQCSDVFMVVSTVDPGVQELQRYGRLWR